MLLGPLYEYIVYLFAHKRLLLTHGPIEVIDYDIQTHARHLISSALIYWYSAAHYLHRTTSKSTPRLDKGTYQYI